MTMIGTGACHPPSQCCFCGAVFPRYACAGYGGEKNCEVCGKGGFGEPDEPEMFYKRVLNTDPDKEGNTA